MFSRKRHWISWTRFRPDPTRPDPDLGAQFSYPIPRPTPRRPDLTLESADAPCWALSYPKDLRGNATSSSPPTTKTLDGRSAYDQQLSFDSAVKTGPYT